MNTTSNYSRQDSLDRRDSSLFDYTKAIQELKNNIDFDGDNDEDRMKQIDAALQSKQVTLMKIEEEEYNTSSSQAINDMANS